MARTAGARRRPSKLAQASAYWRLAAKADKAGQPVQADRYRQIADSRYAEYAAQQRHLPR